MKILKANYKGEGPYEYFFITSLEKTSDSTFCGKTSNGKEYVVLYNIKDAYKDTPYIPYREIKLETYPFKWDIVGLSTFLGNDSILVCRSASNDGMFSTVNLADSTYKLFNEYPNDGNKTVIKYAQYQGRVSLNDRGDRYVSVFLNADKVYFIKVDGMDMSMIKEYEYSDIISSTRGAVSVFSGKTIRYYLDVQFNEGKVYILQNSGKGYDETKKIESEEYNRLVEEGYEKIYKKILVFSED